LAQGDNGCGDGGFGEDGFVRASREQGADQIAAGAGMGWVLAQQRSERLDRFRCLTGSKEMEGGNINVRL